MKTPKLLLIGILLIASFLRLWKINEVPVSLFGDELDVGYHAYSILKTGKDYSGNFMPLHFQSLAEWRTPLYLYSAVPTVAIFGISPWGVRLPAALFGILDVWVFYLLVRLVTGKWQLAILASFLLAVSPWHIQYSRAGFEVTQMLALYLAGVYFFVLAIRSIREGGSGLKDGKWLTASAICFGLTPWSYSTAKLFLPLTVLAVLAIWWRQLLKLPRKQLITAGVVFFMVVSPIAYSTVFGGGTARFNYISVFSDPTTVPEVGFDRLRDAWMRDVSAQIGIQPTVVDRILHNKPVWWGNVLLRNYFQSYSTQFLFINGDLNPRHSPQGIGQLYEYEALFLLLGIAFFLTRPLDKKVKLFFAFWLVAAPIPAALTRDGGMHATRLFFMLPPLVFLVVYGVWSFYHELPHRFHKLFSICYSLILLLSFVFYQHKFWVHYPWDSERWWHAGFCNAIQAAVRREAHYERIIVTTATEPPVIFFLGCSQYPPANFHANLPLAQEATDLGQLTRLGKYYFGSLEDLSMLDKKTLYVAAAKEVGSEPAVAQRKPPVVLEKIAYPSGEPAYYLVSGK